MIQGKTRIVRELEKIVGPNAVIHTEEELRVYECDGATIFRALPDMVVLPATTPQVAEIVKVCHREQILQYARRRWRHPAINCFRG